MKLNFHPDIAEEIKKSYDWYESQSKGLGEEFIFELEKSYNTIIERHDTWPYFYKKFRRFLLPRFPYSIVYRDHPEEIYIVTIMHNSRKPGYWLNRVN